MKNQIVFSSSLFYTEGADDWAARLYKFQLHSIKLLLAEEEENIDQDDKELGIVICFQKVTID